MKERALRRPHAQVVRKKQMCHQCVVFNYRTNCLSLCVRTQHQRNGGKSYVQTNLFTFVRLNIIQNKYFVGVEKASRTIIFNENQNFS